MENKAPGWINSTALKANPLDIKMPEDEREKALFAALTRMLPPHQWGWGIDDQARMALYCLWAAQEIVKLSKDRGVGGGGNGDDGCGPDGWYVGCMLE